MTETLNEKPKQRRTKAPTSFRFSETAQKLLAALAVDTGQSQTGVIELALRDMAKARGVGLDAYLLAAAREMAALDAQEDAEDLADVRRIRATSDPAKRHTLDELRAALKGRAQ